MYDRVNFNEITFEKGDSYTRLIVRLQEIMESLSILEQLVDNIPEGPVQEKMKPIIKVPEGTYYTAVEAARGRFGVFLESHGDKSPYRLHYRAARSHNGYGLPRREDCRLNLNRRYARLCGS